MNPAEFQNIARSERDFWWYRGMREIMFALLDPVVQRGTSLKVLEAGCGTGYFARELQARYGWETTALDLGSEGLACAKGYGLSRLIQGNITALPFGDRRFDAVVSMDVLVHLPRGEEGRALSEFARVLKPGGMLAIRVAAFDLLRSRHSQFVHERQRLTKNRLQKALEAAGFQLQRVTYANALLLPAALVKFRLWESLRKAPPASGVEPVPDWLDAALFSSLRLEANWLAAGGSFPVGQSLIALARR